ncbi:MAG: hypothetical protein N2201_03530 [candidate division WOR-3 bacterium]|nr:hypothetical protein [candidate division WOR-3 bacterium]
MNKKEKNNQDYNINYTQVLKAKSKIEINEEKVLTISKKNECVKILI